MYFIPLHFLIFCSSSNFAFRFSLSLSSFIKQHTNYSIIVDTVGTRVSSFKLRITTNVLSKSFVYCWFCSSPKLRNGWRNWTRGFARGVCSGGLYWHASILGWVLSKLGQVYLKFKIYYFVCLCHNILYIQLYFLSICRPFLFCDECVEDISIKK